MSMKDMLKHTREGATSEIMMKGTGPSPTAKDLCNRVRGVENRRENCLHHKSQDRNAGSDDQPRVQTVASKNKGG
jgi:hypothetical protein